MTQQHLLPALGLTAALFLVSCSDHPAPTPPHTATGLTPAELTAEPDVIAPPDAYVETEWDALVPADWSPDQLLAEYQVEDLEDDDPRAQELLGKLKTMWRDAPVVAGLDGRRIRLPGFIVPLDSQASGTAEFLLVPYYGACIHVPPPPANQTVLVNTRANAPYQGELFDAVWVSGTLRVKATSSELAEAGYLLEGATVTPYE